MKRATWSGRRAVRGGRPCTNSRLRPRMIKNQHVAPQMFDLSESLSP